MMENSIYFNLTSYIPDLARNSVFTSGVSWDRRAKVNETNGHSQINLFSFAHVHVQGFRSLS